MGYKSLAQMPTHRNRPVSSNVRQRRAHTFRVLFGRSKCSARSCMQASVMTPLHFGQCPYTLRALRAGALRRAFSFGRWCLIASWLTGLPSNACEACSQRLCQRTAVGCRFASACCAEQSIGQLHLSSTAGAPACSALLRSLSRTFMLLRTVGIFAAMALSLQHRSPAPNY